MLQSFKENCRKINTTKARLYFLANVGQEFSHEWVKRYKDQKHST